MNPKKVRLPRHFLIFALCGSMIAQCSLFHAAGSNNRVLSSSVTLTLPATSSNDIVYCAAALQSIGSGTPFNVPSGWTADVNTGNLIVIHQVWTSGTSVTISQNTGGNWINGGCVSYTGGNTSTPSDMANSYIVASSTSANPKVHAPSAFPSWTTDCLIAFFDDQSQFGLTITGSGSLTTRFNSGAGPSVMIQDAALLTANPTGDFSASFSTSTGSPYRMGATVLLKPASGGTSATRTVQPTEAGRYYDAGTGSWASLFPQTHDLINVQGFGVGNSCSISTTGYSTVFNANDMLSAVHAFTSGDATSLSSSGCLANSDTEVVLIRNATGGTAPTVDPAASTGGTATASSATTISPPNISISGSNELAVVQYSAGHNGAANTGTWTLPGALTPEVVFVDSAVAVGSGSEPNPSNPTATLTGTNSVSGTQNAGITVFCISCSARTAAIPAVY